MSTLYELTGDWLQLYNMMDDVDADADMIIDTIEGIDFEIEVKAEGYAKVLAQLNSDAECYAKEIERLTAKKKAAENRATRLKESLQKSMELTGKTSFKTKLFSFNVQKNAPSVVIDDESMIPERFLVPQAPKVNKQAIKDELKNGEVLLFAHLESSKSLRIR